MTGDDHNTDALIAALRSPALPAEQVGEAAAVAAMLEALGRAPAPSTLRARRGIAIAAVTVASLGVGGLAAAGPGIFTAAAERARSIMSAESDEQSSDGVVVIGGNDSSDTAPDGSAQFPPEQYSAVPAETDVETTVANPAPGVGANATPAAGNAPSDDVECAPGPHGATVSSVAHASIPPDARNRGEVVSEPAESDCGKGNMQDDDDDATATSNGNGRENSNGRGNANAHDNNGQQSGPPASTPSGVVPPAGPPETTPSGVVPPAGPPETTPSGVAPPVGPPASTPASDAERESGQAGGGAADQNADAPTDGQGNSKGNGNP